jgi:hypothetical protein
VSSSTGNAAIAWRVACHTRVFVSVPFQPMATPVWTAPYASLPLNSGSGGDGRVEGAIATLLARVGARRAWSPDRSQRTRRHVESEHLDVGGDVVAHDVVGAAQPEAGALAAGSLAAPP